MESVLSNGVLAGFPVLGMKAVLVDGAFHDVDSSVMAFEIAGRAACREGLRKAGARLMEPIMQVRERRIDSNPGFLSRKRRRCVRWTVRYWRETHAFQKPSLHRSGVLIFLGVVCCIRSC